MRKQIVAAMSFMAIVASPVGVIAEPVTHLKTINEHKVVGNIQAVINHEIPTKDEVAAEQIALNLKKLEEEEKRRKAEQAAKAAAQRKASVAKRRIIAVDNRKDFSALYEAAGARFGVSPALLAAVHYVETGQRGNTNASSYAGAQGPMQFLPSTFRAYAVDGDGDGVANIYDVDDAVFSASRYLASNGAASGSIVNALFRYNHSMSYVYKVMGIARGFGLTG